MTRPHQSYQHEAFLYRGDDEFLEGSLDFVREGVALRQPVMVAVPEPRLSLLTAALGPVADDVLLVDMADMGRNPARIIPAWQVFVEEHGGAGHPVRGIGEPVWAGRRPVEIAECQLHEALLNLAIEPDVPMWLRCPYDADALEQAILDEALHSHPTLVDDGHYRGSTSYGGADHADTVFGGGLPDPVGDTEILTFSGDDLHQVRERVGRHAVRAGLDEQRTRDLVLAISELATNSIRYGGGHGTLRMWQEPGALVCDVRDAGHIVDPLVGRRRPSLTEEGGRGVWLANQLCDLTQLRSSPDGTSVRTVVWLQPQSPPSLERLESLAAALS